jgi:C4-dicarboxylate-specific signal transduction histidine kinase
VEAAIATRGAAARCGTVVESEAAVATLSGEPRTVLFSIAFPPPPATLKSVLVSVMDVTERRRTEEAQAELAHISRVTTMAEMAASIAHEINQPLAAVVTNGGASLRWLSSDPPNLDEARAVVSRIISDGNRASAVIARVRALLKKSVQDHTSLTCMT